MSETGDLEWVDPQKTEEHKESPQLAFRSLTSSMLNPNDAKHIAVLMRRCLPSMYAQASGAELEHKVRHDLFVPQDRILLFTVKGAEAGTAPVGLSHYAFDSENSVLFKGVLAPQEHQEAMIRMALEQAKNDGCEVIRTKVMSDKKQVIDVYKRIGFKQEEQSPGEQSPDGTIILVYRPSHGE